MREDAVFGQLGLLRNMLPTLLKRLNQIKDPRNPKKIVHKLTVLILYGLLSFVFQMLSRRESNQKMSLPAFKAALQEMFPELETLPHADTLARLLERLDPREIEQAHLDIFRRFIRSKKFRRYLVRNCYPIAIDGTQKVTRDGQWQAIEWLERRWDKGDGDRTQQYVYVLEANLVLHNGLSIPLMSEFLSYEEGDPDNHKQDCELKALKRLAERLKKEFPHLPIMLLLDGLYPNGPVMELCQQYCWDYMIVLPSQCLPSVWQEVERLKPLQQSNQRSGIWRGRQQKFQWVNDINYDYDHDRRHIGVHIVICDEEWEEIDRNTGENITLHTRHAWISAVPLNHRNVLESCNSGARCRWGIEHSMLVEKHHGYSYEHIFSYAWNAMRGFHYLMRLAHMLNALALHTKKVRLLVKELGGLQRFLEIVRESCANRWLSPEWRRAFVSRPFQLRLE
jgi:hypothetical protein